MNVRVLPAGSLSTAEKLRWAQIQRETPSLASPYFCHQFTAIVASARSDVHVAVLQDGDRILGFFPFQRGRLGLGRPAGAPLSDYHGVIAAEDVALDAGALLRSCGLGVWEFDHLPASQTSFAPYFRAAAQSPVIDLSEGFEAYAHARQQAGSRMISSTGRKARKLGREEGPLRYESHSTDPAVFEALLRWKSDQSQRTGATDVLRQEWVRSVLRDAVATQSEEFAGMLSALYAGDRLVAAHLGIRSSTVWHYWFPAYDTAFARHSPGLILLLKMAESAPSLDLRAIDLGKGDYPYKLALMNRAVPLTEGFLERPSLIAAAGRTRRTARSLIRRTALAPRLRRLARGAVSR